jgi:hypothetical protein
MSPSEKGLRGRRMWMGFAPISFSPTTHPSGVSNYLSFSQLPGDSVSSLACLREWALWGAHRLGPNFAKGWWSF